MESFPFETYKPALEFDPERMTERSLDFFNMIKQRRTVRHFSSRPVPRQVIENCIKAAGTAPNGANKQPWFFAIIESQEKKKLIREAAEKEEKEFYRCRASKEWLNDLKFCKTNANKPYLEKAPYLIAIFYKTFDWNDEQKKSRCYYPKESIGIATGMLITALHHSGLSTLTHTPSPMNFLNHTLDVPTDQYKPFLLLVAGYPDDEAQVPVIEKKKLEEISRFY